MIRDLVDAADKRQPGQQSDKELATANNRWRKGGEEFERYHDWSYDTFSDSDGSSSKTVQIVPRKNLKKHQSYFHEFILIWICCKQLILWHLFRFRWFFIKNCSNSFENKYRAMNANRRRLYTGGWKYEVDCPASSPAHRVVWVLHHFQSFGLVSHFWNCAKDIYGLLVQMNLPLPTDISICRIVVWFRLTSNRIHKNVLVYIY